MLYDAAGNLLSSENPSISAVKAGMEEFEKSNSYASGRASNYGSGNYSDFPIYMMNPSIFGHLSYAELRNLYETSSSVRPAVDSITREIKGTPWEILHKDMKFHPELVVEILTDFFNKINFDNEDFSTVISHFANDYLVVGKGVIEKVRNPYGQIIEIRACDASRFCPVYSERYGALTSYKEDLGNGKFRIHSKDDIIFKNYATVTYSYAPVPIIETIVNEVALLMLTIKNMGAAFSGDDIPPGILHLGNIGVEALDRARASFKETKNLSEKGFTIKVVDNVDKVQWVQFNRPFREMQLAELIPIIERIVARNFGIAAVDVGLDAGGKTSATIGKQSSQAKMLIPIMQMIETFVNNEILSEIFDGVKFKYNTLIANPDTEQEKNLMAEVRLGLISINEFRLSVGRKPVKGGDLRYVLLGNEFVPIDPNTGLPQYQLGLFGPGRGGQQEEKPKEEPKEKPEENSDEKEEGKEDEANS